jgi:cholesterol oxidase
MQSFRFFGIMKLTILKHVAVLSRTAVGGGSLVYANTLLIPKPTFFNTSGWSKLIDWKNELAPYYHEALRIFGAAKNPKLFDGDIGLKKVAHKLGMKDKFDSTNVAIYFGEENVTKENPYFEGIGPERTGCNFCGACMTKCRNNSKNTLDKKYLHLAQKYGAVILSEHEVYDVRPINTENGFNGYEVSIKTTTKLFTEKVTLEAKA